MTKVPKATPDPAREPGPTAGWLARLCRGRRGGVAIIALAVLIVVGAWWGWRTFSGPRIQGVRHVVLISIDTCRADRLSCYGYKRPSTPNIDAVAREGALFQNALTPVPVTTPAHASMLTGTYPPTHGVRMNNGECLGQSNVTLAEVLQKAGYRTGGFVGALPLDRRFGLDQGFDTYDCQYTRKRFPEMPADERTAEEVNASALPWLEKNAKNPFFLFLHYFDAHVPYEPPMPWAADYADDLYAGEIAHVDQGIGQVLDKLRAMGLYDDTLVIITGDHGESMGEHGEASHGFFMYQSTMQVPLVIRSPRGAKGLKVAGNVSLVDIVPTVLDLAGLKGPSRVEGVSLRGCLEGGGVVPDRTRAVYGESLWPATYDCGALHGVVEGPWKYIRAPRQELYDLSRDPGERDNLIEKSPDVARRLRGRLEAELREMEAAAVGREPSTVDRATMKRLGGLGYVVGGSVPPSSAFDPKREDPKDFVATHELLVKVCSPAPENHGEQAKKDLLKIVKARPGLITAQAMLAQLAMKEGRLAEAAGYAERIVNILAASKDSPQPITVGAANVTAGDFDTRDLARAHFNLAVLLKDQGKGPEAIGHYEQAVQIRPDYADAHLNLGVLLQQAGQGPEAIGHYEQALRANPDFAVAHGNLAMALHRTGKLPEAIGHYEQALRLKPDYGRNNPAFAAALGEARSASQALERCRKVLATRPADAEANTELGNVLSRIGQVAEAIGHYEQALRARPDSAPAHYNLAVAMGQAGRATEAIAHQKEAIRLSGDFVLAMNYLAWMLATQDDPKLRDGAEAVRLAQRACQLTGDKEWTFLDTLAAAYAEAGRLPEAVATARKALALAQSANQPAAAADVQSRLALYRAGQCYREPPSSPASRP